MAGHGSLINSRMYYQSTDDKGNPVNLPSPVKPGDVQYQEQTYEDGTKVVSKWDPSGDQWVQDKVSVDPQIAGQYRRDNPTAKPPQRPQGPKQLNTPSTEKTIVTVDADGNRTETPNPDYVDPSTKQITPAEQAQIDADTGRLGVAQQNADTNARKADLAALTQQAQQKKAELMADVAAGRLDHQAALLEWQKYKTQNIDGPIRQTMAEAATIRAQATQQNADTRTAGEQSLAGYRDTRNDLYGMQLQNQNTLAGLNYAQTAGQNAARNALDVLPYEVGPGFGNDFAGALHTLSSGGGPVNFQGSDFTYKLPDLNAMAQQGADAAIARLKAGLGSFGAAVNAPQAAAPVAPVAPITQAAPAVQPAPSPSPAVQPAAFPNSPSPAAAAVAANDPQVIAWLMSHQGGA